MADLSLAPDGVADDEIELGDLRKILLSNKFDIAMSEFDAEIKEVEQIFQYTKEHTLAMMKTLDDPTDAPTRRMNTQDGKRKVSTIYITSQMSNLVSLKNLKMGMLKEKNNLYQSSLDRAFKIVNQITKDQREGAGGGDLPYDAILGFLLTAGIKVPISQGADISSAKLLQNEDDIDAQLMDIADKEGLVNIDARGAGANKSVPTEDEILVESDELATAIFFDRESDKLYLVTADYTIVREISEDDIDAEENENGDLVCKNFKLPIEVSDVEEEPEA